MLLLVPAGCGEDVGDTNVARSKSPPSAFRSIDSGHPALSNPVYLRLRNGIDVPFDRVEVETGTGATVNYGPLSTGAVSAYIQAHGIHRYAFIDAASGDRAYGYRPIDYAGEQPLPTGYYTYVLRPGRTFPGDPLHYLRIELETDAPPQD